MVESVKKSKRSFFLKRFREARFLSAPAWMREKKWMTLTLESWGDFFYFAKTHVWTFTLGGVNSACDKFHFEFWGATKRQKEPIHCFLEGAWCTMDSSTLSAINCHVLRWIFVKTDKRAQQSSSVFCQQNNESTNSSHLIFSHPWQREHILIDSITSAKGEKETWEKRVKKKT